MKKVVINKRLVSAEIEHVLGHIELSIETKRKLNSILVQEKVKKHDLILKPGDVCDFWGVVQKGMVQVYHYKNKKLISDFFATEGYGFFDIESFVTGKPTEATIEALEPTVYVKMDRAKFLKLCDEEEELNTIYQKVLEFTLILCHNRLDSVLNDSAEDKYENLEKRIPGLASRISAINVASYIGVTQETLCRIKSKQEDFLLF
ncbi:MAG: cyclic nucleotide-binding domain-containing protein [Paludibacteraceae bacterium]|nr:cyclic nucleotide-binding domain-containing protein [Paludibacteraceae bacterium]MBR5972045.1 cyclic nucleotide-binding domain-containing protein [Paludibacteraceae bacterium]